ncbi:MAG: hypothetical protein ACLP50_13245 [Solirubrobacteraceae bacterium]
MEICVVHLAWADAGPPALEQFLASYLEHPAGVAHRLVIAWNGYRDRASLGQAQRIFGAVEHEDLELGAPERDLTVYRLAAEQFADDAICFLNSFSTILQDGWLKALTGALEAQGVGLVGATGSWESPLSGARLPRRLLRAGRYPPFPNPHLRTNAFMLRRALMLELRWPRVTTKRAAWELESGMRGVTRQIEAQGLVALVVGRDGESYPRERWPQSATFRWEEQQNLLIADNRTRQYAEAPPRLRRRLAALAWGDAAAAGAGAGVGLRRATG